MLNLLLPLDGSELSERALAHAIAIARSVPCKVTLLRIVTPAEFRADDAFSRVDWRLHRYQARTYLEGAAKEFTDVDTDCDIRVEEGRPAELIINVANEKKSPLLVMSTHGRGGATDFPQGGVASKVLSTVNASVLLVGARDIDPSPRISAYSRILAVIDGSPQSECTLRSAAAFAQHMQATLYVVFLADSTELPALLSGDSRAQQLSREIDLLMQTAASRRLAELRATLPESLDPQLSVVVTNASTSPLPELARRYDPDLILTGTDTLDRADRQLNTASVSIGRAPLLILSPKGIGAAICERTEQRDSNVAHADVS